MATTEGSGWSPTDLFLGLPPQLQGVAIVVSAAVVGYLFYQKYLSHAKGERPSATSTDFAVGDPTVFADMTPLKSLVRSAAQLTEQMTLLCELAGQHLTEMREQRDREAVENARREGYEAGLSARPRKTATRRRAAPKRTGDTT